MGLDLEYLHGQTPLDEDENHGLLIKSITTQGELDEHEQLNIEKAIQWTLESKFKMELIFTEEFVKKLHQKMYCDVWRWAGHFRNSAKNRGVEWTEISVCLRQLLDDALYWIHNKSYSNKEIAIRFKHRLVLIHCFPNGNGRHSRLMADVIMEHVFGEPVFAWKNSNLLKADQGRAAYITALMKADQGDLLELMDFAVSDEED